jgi:hypothetical protein
VVVVVVDEVVSVIIVSVCVLDSDWKLEIGRVGFVN